MNEIGQIGTERDQRGAPRPVFGGVSLRCDLGAYERQDIVALPLIRW